jgi:hypothetical protein
VACLFAVPLLVLGAVLRERALRRLDGRRTFDDEP